MNERLRQERQDNVAAYVVRMWHLEDVLRAVRFDPEAIRTRLVEPMDVDAEQKRLAQAWYTDLAERMVQEGLSRQGHLPEVNEAITDLEALHHALLNVLEDPTYVRRYMDAREDIDSLNRQREDEEPVGVVETCFTGLYGVMLLRAQGREVSEATRAADARIRALLEALSTHYRHMRKLPGVSLN
ncbi:MAG: DUF4924 family protein [Flavobacteriales bacterium]|nr:DUF4924 family protein [Flavobacteriales bacterium]